MQERLETWITEIIGERLKPLVEIAGAQDIAGLARGIAFRLKESFGVLRRESVAEEIRSLDQPARAQLRQLRRSLRRLQHLLPAPAEAGLRRARSQCCGR